MRVCRVGSIRSFGHGKHRPVCGKDDVCFLFVCIRQGLSAAACPGGCMHAGRCVARVGDRSYVACRYSTCLAGSLPNFRLRWWRRLATWEAHGGGKCGRLIRHGLLGGVDGLDGRRCWAGVSRFGCGVAQEHTRCGPGKATRDTDTANKGRKGWTQSRVRHSRVLPAWTCSVGVSSSS